MLEPCPQNRHRQSSGLRADKRLVSCPTQARAHAHTHALQTGARLDSRAGAAVATTENGERSHGNPLEGAAVAGRSQAGRSSMRALSSRTRPAPALGAPRASLLLALPVTVWCQALVPASAIANDRPIIKLYLGRCAALPPQVCWNAGRGRQLRDGWRGGPQQQGCT